MKNSTRTAIHNDQTTLEMPRHVFADSKNHYKRIEAYKKYMRDAAALILRFKNKQVNIRKIDSETNKLLISSKSLIL